MAPRILLVDDEVAVRSVVARALREEMYEVVEASDGREAWGLAQAAPFDLVITDSRMPHLTGTELITRLHGRFPTLPILRISGSHSRTEGVVDGVAVLHKPFTLDGLARSVRSLVPVAKLSPRPATDSTAPPPLVPADKGCEGCQVLVVEDEPGLRRLTTRLLQVEGYTVHEAEDGEAALEFLRTTSERVDVVISDVVMPRLNGVALLERLATSHPDLPCILVTGYGGDHLESFGIALPCGVLTKPVPSDVLLAKVQHCRRLGAARGETAE